jgi:hypothetical protein
MPLYILALMKMYVMQTADISKPVTPIKPSHDRIFCQRNISLIS